MTTWSSQRRSVCSRRILRPLELRNYSARPCRRDRQAAKQRQLEALIAGPPRAA